MFVEIMARDGNSGNTGNTQRVRFASHVKVNDHTQALQLQTMNYNPNNPNDSKHFHAVKPRHMPNIKITENSEPQQPSKASARIPQYPQKAAQPLQPPQYPLRAQPPQYPLQAQQTEHTQQYAQQAAQAQQAQQEPPKASEKKRKKGLLSRMKKLFRGNKHTHSPQPQSPEPKHPPHVNAKHKRYIFAVPDPHAQNGFKYYTQEVMQQILNHDSMFIKHHHPDIYAAYYTQLPRLQATHYPQNNLNLVGKSPNVHLYPAMRYIYFNGQYWPYINHPHAHPHAHAYAHGGKKPKKPKTTKPKATKPKTSKPETPKSTKPKKK